MVTKEMIVDAVTRQKTQAEKLIAQMKDEGDLAHFERIKSLELAGKACDLVIRNMNWDKATQEELQGLYNTVLLWENLTPIN